MTKWRRLERICMIGLILALIVMALLLAANFLPFASDLLGKSSEKKETPTSTQLMQASDLDPKNCHLAREVPDITLQQKDGSSVSLSSLRGRVTVLTFWASWCPHCQKLLAQSQAISETVSQYGNVSYYLVNKTDGKKETETTAEQYLSSHGVGITSLYDNGLAAYNELGLRTIPTTLVIDGNGILRGTISGDSWDPQVLDKLKEKADLGGSSGVSNFILNKMTDGSGAVRTSYLKESGQSPTGGDVISESQGFMMDYAVTSENKELFEKTWKYTADNMLSDPLVSWMLSDGKPARVNAALDDLRIYDALCRANALWGGYDDELSTYGNSLLKYNTNDGTLINFYDFQHKKKASVLSLCYADFAGLSFLVANDPDNWQSIYDNSAAIVEGGMISDVFPWYYSQYDFSKKQYLKDDINSAEELQTMLSLSRIGKLPQETVQWLKNALDNEGIFGRYTVGGDVVPEYKYESTAVYAMVAQIASVIGDEDLAAKAVKRMEKMQITSGDLSGAFGNADGSGIYSFDQFRALQAYEDMENWKSGN